MGEVVRNPGVAIDRVDIPKPRHCFFIGGMTATNSALRANLGIGPALSRAYGGDEHVSLFNSIISTDERNPRRFQQMAEVIRDHAADGLDVVVHSLGVTELYKALKLLERNDPEFLNNEAVKNNMRFVVIGPSGSSKGLRERIAYPFRTRKDARDVQYSALTAFPPQDVSPEQLTDVLAAVSNKRDGVPTVVFPERAVRSNNAFLTNEEQAALTQYDAELRSAIEAEERDTAEGIIVKRGEVVRRPIQQVFGGMPIEATGKKNRMKMGRLQGLRVLIRAAGKKPMEKLIDLSDMGYRVEFYVPEFDIVKPLSTIVKFFKNIPDQSRLEVKIVPGSHAGIALQPDAYAAVIASQE